MPKTKPKYQDEEWLREQYWEKKKTEYEIAEICDTSQSCIHRWMEKLNIERRDQKEQKYLRWGGEKRYRDKAWLKEKYIEEEKSAPEIAKICSCAYSTISRWLDIFDIETRGNKPEPPEIIEGRKQCSQCGNWLPLNQFYSNIDRTTNLNSCCKDCKDKRRKEKWENKPGEKLSFIFASHIRHALKSNKNGRHWENLVSYNLEDLKEHLESQFKDGMKWDNYGDWHIDHIIPRSHFDYENPEDEEFQECWALDNLQPLWAEENLRKSDKLNWEAKNEHKQHQSS